MVRTMKNIVSVLLAALFFCSGCSFARAAETDEPLPCREAEDWNALFDRRGRLTPGEEPGRQRTVSLLQAFLQKVLRFILRFSKRH